MWSYRFSICRYISKDSSEWLPPFPPGKWGSRLDLEVGQFCQASFWQDFLKALHCRSLWPTHHKVKEWLKDDNEALHSFLLFIDLKRIWNHNKIWDLGDTFVPYFFYWTLFSWNTDKNVFLKKRAFVIFWYISNFVSFVLCVLNNFNRISTFLRPFLIF